MKIKYKVGIIIGKLRAKNMLKVKKYAVKPNQVDVNIDLPQFLGKAILKSWFELLKYLSCLYMTGLKLLTNLGTTKYPIINNIKPPMLQRKLKLGLVKKYLLDASINNHEINKISNLIMIIKRFNLLSVVSKWFFNLFINSMAKIFNLKSYIISSNRLIINLLLIFLSFNIQNTHANNYNTNELLKYIRQIEQKYDIPKDLLLSIAKVESALNPYAINVAGQSFQTKSFEEALYIIEKARERNISNIDIGLMQINFKYHSENFQDIEQMLSPEANIEYAAKFLRNLYEQTASWPMSIKRYHSANEHYHKIYAKKILIAWLKTN